VRGKEGDGKILKTAPSSIAKYATGAMYVVRVRWTEHPDFTSAPWLVAKNIGLTGFHGSQRVFRMCIMCCV
jgi:hypothetical protein